MSWKRQSSTFKKRSFKVPSQSEPQQRRKLPHNLLVRRVRFIYLKLLRLRDKPQVLAKGLGVGVFAGCFPFFGLQSPIGIVLAAICRGSKLAAVAATWISNPLTYVPLYVFNYKIGKLLLGIEDTVLLPLDLESFTTFREQGSAFAIALLTGSFVTGTVLATITYFYSLAILERWRARSIRRRSYKRRKK